MDRPAWTIRLADLRDAAPISGLIWRLTCETILPDQPETAIGRLRTWMSRDAVSARIARGDRHYVADSAGRLIGVVGTRDDAHLHLLYVDTPFQHQGIGRALWNTALDACVAASRPQRITVNAAAGALAAYSRLGFERLGASENRDGVVSTPMSFRTRLCEDC